LGEAGRSGLRSGIRTRTLTSTAHATVLVAASACCFGAISIFTLIATGAGATLPMLLAARFAIATAALLALVGGPHAMRLPRSRAVPLIAIGGVGQVLVTWFGLSALRYVPAATAAFLFYTYPAWVTLTAVARRTERLSRRRLLALTLALVGVALMVGSPWSGRLDGTGVALALAAAVVYAAYIPLLGRAQAGIAPAVASGWVSGAAGAIYLVAGALTGTLIGPADALRAWGAITGLALISTVAGFVLFLRGLQVLGPVRTAIISTIEPFCTALLAAVVLGQRLSPLTLAGGLLIAGAVGLLQGPESGRPAEHHD
jgi:drug/metabolite transporter (DMT)-like permease